MTSTDPELTARAIVAGGKGMLAADETPGTLTKRLAWGGREDNVPAAQRAFYHRARCDAAAANGPYSCAVEAPSAAALPPLVAPGSGRAPGDLRRRSRVSAQRRQNRSMP